MKKVRAMTRHRGTPLPAIKARRLVTSSKGQTTVEYLVVGLAIFAVIAGMSVLGGRIQEGLFTDHAAKSASHAITSNTAGTIGDVLLY